MNPRSHFADGVDEIEIVLVRQLRIDSAYHMNFRDRDIQVSSDRIADVVEREQVGIGAALFRVLGKVAELAVLVADVGVVDVLVANIESAVAVHSLADHVRHVADR